MVIRYKVGLNWYTKWDSSSIWFELQRRHNRRYTSMSAYLPVVVANSSTPHPNSHIIHLLYLENKDFLNISVA